MRSAPDWQSKAVFAALVLSLVTVRQDRPGSLCLSPPPLLLFKSHDIHKVVALLDATEVSLESIFAFPSGGCYLSLNLHRLFPCASTPSPFQSRLGTAPNTPPPLLIMEFLVHIQFTINYSYWSKNRRIQMQICSSPHSLPCIQLFLKGGPQSPIWKLLSMPSPLSRSKLSKKV